MKILYRGLTTCPQKQITAIIDTEQSGFIAEHNIVKNFIYTTEMVQCWFKHKNLSPVFKLDFAKSFDSITWSSLHKIMEIRGFPAWWCDWMDVIFTMSRSTILLNGVPRKWFPVRRRPPQGDPLSPYLFLLMVDAL